MFRIITSEIPEIFQFFQGCFFPFLLFYLAQQIFFIQCCQCRLSFFLISSCAQFIRSIARSLHLIDIRSIYGFDPDLSVFSSASQFFFADQIFQPINTSDEILTGDHFLFHFQEISGNLHFHPGIPPGSLIQIQTVFDCSIQMIPGLFCLFQTQSHRLFFSGSDQKLFHMLIGHRVSGHPPVQAFVSRIFSLQHFQKALACIKTKCLPIITLRQFDKCFQIIHCSAGCLNPVVCDLCVYRHLVFSQVTVDRNHCIYRLTCGQSLHIQPVRNTYGCSRKFFFCQQYPAIG